MAAAGVRLNMFSIVAGSYEKILYGLRPDFTVDAARPKLKPFFIFPAHTSCIKALAGSPGGKWLATGSADEIIKIWDLRRRKEVGGLVQHDGARILTSFSPPALNVKTPRLDNLRRVPNPLPPCVWL